MNPASWLVLAASKFHPTYRYISTSEHFNTSTFPVPDYNLAAIPQQLPEQRAVPVDALGARRREDQREGGRHLHGTERRVQEGQVVRHGR